MMYFDEFNNFINLLNIVSEMIPDGTEKEVEIGGTKVSLTKKDGSIKINTQTKFDDSSIKNLVKRYQTSIKELEDDMFVEISEKLGQTLNLKEFDNLLNLETFNETQAAQVEEMIDVASTLTRNYLASKINDLVNLRNKF